MLPVSGRTPEWRIAVDGRETRGAIHRRLGRDYLFVSLEGDRQGTPLRVTVAGVTP
jgi:hypothetical protein